MGLSALLLLADGRLPAGGYAHSGGAETACAQGLVHDDASLSEFLVGRLHTAGLLAAGAAASSWLRAAQPSGIGTDRGGSSTPGLIEAGRAGAGLIRALSEVDAEVDARTPSPAARAASRAQGRALLRVATTAWPSPSYLGLTGAHHGVVLGVVAQVAECTAVQAAAIAALQAVSGPASAALRLLGLDPYRVTGIQADLAPAADRVARQAVAAARRGELASGSAPNLDLLAEQHAAASAPLFAS